jgi:Ca2+-binding EF-hand superfamily protein
MNADGTAYNKGNNRGAKVGNWVEENALEERTGYHRSAALYGPTFERVLAHDQSQDYKNLRSLNYETYSREALVGREQSRVGPRARARDKELMRRAFEETKMEPPQRSYFTTSSGDAYVKQPFLTRVGCRVMKSLDGNPIPTEGRDNDFLVEFNLTRPKATTSEDKLRENVPYGDYTKQEVITMYTMGAPTTGSTAGGSITSHGRSSGFTNPIQDGSKTHNEGTDTHHNKVRGAPPPPRPLAGAAVNVQPLIAGIKEKILERSGSDGVHALSRLLKMFDADGNGKLSRAELVNGLRDSGVNITPAVGDTIFSYFDKDRSGFVTVPELMRGLRGGLNEGRQALVDEAFRRLDKSGDGYVTVEDLAQAYDVSQLPEVKSGKLTPEQALRNFASQWDGGEKDGIITKEEFSEYYANLGAAIENDSYFELMMRNAWHISGGTGWAANTTCLRVLVTHSDGRQTVEEIEDDLGMPRTDTSAMKAFLEKKGMKVAKLSLCGP